MGPFPLGRVESAVRGPSSDQPPATWWRFHPQQLISLGVLVTALLLVACDADALQSTFGPAGPVAEKQLLLFNVLLWAMVVVFVLVEGALLYSLIRFRRRPGDPLPAQTHGHTGLEIAWTVIPTILILVLGIWSVVTLFELEPPPASANTLEVTVTGHQWWWEFEYQDADGSGRFINTANELVVPVGKPVNLLLNSDDVIHSFWVPRLAGKVDVVPTRNNRMWFQGDEIGTFYGQCAEFCGIAHALMRFRVQVLSEADYMAWVETYGQAPGTAEPLSPQAKQGQQIFLDFSAGGCSICHTIQDVPGAAGVIGPNLTGLGSKDTFGAGILDLNRENLRRWLNNPNEVKPGNRMSEQAPIYQTADGSISLSPQEVSALIEYLLSLK
jgi:cytochrome c oxidase subunit 2